MRNKSLERQKLGMFGDQKRCGSERGLDKVKGSRRSLVADGSVHELEIRSDPCKEYTL